MSDSKILKYKERLKSLKSKSLSELKSILKTQLRIVSTSGYGKDTAISEILENEFGSKFMNEINSKEKSSDNITARTVLEKFGKNKSEGGKTPLKVIQPYKIHANEITEKGDHYEVTYSTSVNHNKAIDQLVQLGYKRDSISAPIGVDKNTYILKIDMKGIN